MSLVGLDHIKLLIVQLLIGVVVLASGLVVCFCMLLTFIVVWPFSKDWYRRLCYQLAYLYLCQWTCIGQWWSNSDLTLVFENAADEKFIGSEHAVVISNHRYELDWLVLWIFANQYKTLGGCKVNIKSSIKHVPVIGWMFRFLEFIFLEREWVKDRETIKRSLASLVQYPVNYWINLLLFCEGTRFTKEKLAASNEVARQKGVPELKHHLLPRSKGFVLSMHGIKGKISSVFDFTTGIKCDNGQPSLNNILKGIPCHTEIYIRRFKTDDIPTETDDACAEWIQQLYREKDEIFEDFDQNGTFTTGTRVVQPRRRLDLIFTIFWFLLIWIPLLRYISVLFISGSLAMKLGFVGSIASFFIIMRLLIGVTEIKKGSKYGKQK